MADVIVISSNSFTTATTNYSVPVVNTLSAPTEVAVLNSVQMINNTSGTSTQYWNLSSDTLYPISSTYKTVIGGGSVVSDEILRVLGKINATSISFATDSYRIYTSGGDMYLQDTVVTKKLSDLGGVLSVAAGAGMQYTTITGAGTTSMGTPSTITSTSVNSASGTTHTHAVDSTIVNSGTTYSNPAWITSLSETKVLPSQSGKTGYYLTSNGVSSAWQPISLSNDVFYWSGTSYTPYSSSTAGKFDNSSTSPSSVNRLNYNGYLYATQLHGQHVVGGTSGDLAYTNGNYIATGIGNWNGTTLTVDGNIQGDIVYVKDVNTYITTDVGGNMTFTDVVSGVKTLTEIISGATNFWTSTTSGIYRVGSVAIGGTTFTAGSALSVTGVVTATNFDSSIYRWRNSNICIGANAGDNELNSNRVYIDKTNTANPMLYGDMDLRYWIFNGDTYWAVNKKQYFSSTTNQLYADASNNLTFKDGVAASGVAIPLVNLINGTYNALKSDFASGGTSYYSNITGITAGSISNWNTAYTKSSVISISGAGTHFLGADGVYRPISATLSLYDNILSFDSVNGWYEPYTTKTAGCLYNTDATMPSSTNQLKYDGYLYATRVYVKDILSDVLNTNGSTKTAGYFDTGTTDPSSTNRLNYDGYLYTTRTMSARMDINPLSATSGIFMVHPYNNVTGVSVAMSGTDAYGVAVNLTGTTTGYAFYASDSTTNGGYGVWSTSANGIGVYGSSSISTSGRFNNATGNTANILEAQLNGVNKAYIDKDGNVKSLVLNTAGGTKTAANFYTGTTAPTDTNRLNYSGYLYATQLYDNGLRVSTSLPAYGSLSFGSGTVATTLGTVSCTNSTTTWTWADIADSDLVVGDQLLVTGTAATGKLTIDTGGDGKYLVTYNISAKSSRTAGNLAAVVELGGTAQTSTINQGVHSASYSYVVLSGSAILNLVATNELNLAIASASDTNATITIGNVCFTATRISL